MLEDIDIIKEFDIIREFQMPHLVAKTFSLQIEKNIAFSTLSRKQDEVLLINASGFDLVAILTGLSEIHVEYFTKNAPFEYKQALYTSISDEYKVKDIIELSKALDDDLGGGSTKNQERVKNVIQYVKDNRIAFEF